MALSWKWFERYVLRSKWLKDPVPVLLVLWGLFIFYGTLLPFKFSASGDLIAQKLKLVWERPLRGSSWADVQANVLFFVPWGFLLAVWMARRGFGFIASVAIALCAGAFLSCTVELLQLFAPSRNTSFVDLVTNSFGATVGALFGWPWIRLVWPVASIRLRQLISARPLLTCAILTCVVLLSAGLSPFRFEPRMRDVREALRAAQLAPFKLPPEGPVRSAKPLNWAAELLTWTLAGGLFALAARESRESSARAVVWALAVAFGLSLTIETVQLTIPDRDVDVSSVVIALLGSLMGAIILERTRNQDPRRLINAAIAVWALAVILALWNPPRFTWSVPTYLQTAMFVPFWSYFHTRSLADLADVISQVLIFMPLGALLAARSHRQSLVGALILGLSFGLLLEIGQAFIPDRSADISDAISAGLGAVAGWTVWRWGEWTRTSSIGTTRYRVGRPAGLRG
jgi:glycopeptide antibiotics resistance protein